MNMMSRDEYIPGSIYLYVYLTIRFLFSSFLTCTDLFLEENPRYQSSEITEFQIAFKYGVNDKPT